MQARRVVFYTLAGALAGCLAGLLAAAALGRFGEAGPAGLLLAACSGLVVSAGGGAAMRSRRAFLSEIPAGTALAVGLFALGRAFPSLVASSGNTPALAAVASVIVFSAAVAALHTWHVAGSRVAFVSAIFASIGGLAALAASASLVNATHPYLTLAAAGGIYGAAVWAAVGVARRLFGVDVEEFRV